jgi:hypothetical protein
MRSSQLLGLALAGQISMGVATGYAQQAPRPARSPYFGRVETQGSSASAARPRLRLELSRSGQAPGTSAADPPRPYERPPEVTPPREMPRPAASHNYFPGLRAGQGPNRNGSRCVPGRHAFLR